MIEMQAVKVYEGKECSHYKVDAYRVTTYPGSNHIYMVRWDKTSKRVVGHKIEAAARAAIIKIGGLG